MVWTSLVVVLVLLAVSSSVGARSSTYEPLATPPAANAPAGPVSTYLQYQGRLTNPATGQGVSDNLYVMAFSLYDVASGGTALWTETKSVPVFGGLFSTALGDSTALPILLFNGQALWLGIKVGSDAEAAPRQAILPTAYALDADLLDGQHANSFVNATVAENRYVNVAGPDTMSGSSTFAILAVTQNGSGAGVSGYSAGGAGVYGASPNSYGVKGEAGGVEPGVFGSNSGTGSGVYGYSGNANGVFGESFNAYGGFFIGNNGMYARGTPGVGGYFTSTSTYGVQGETASTSYGQAGIVGAAGWSGTTFNRVVGVLGQTVNGYGVAGASTNYYGTLGLSNNSDGVRGEAIGSGAGVSGYGYGGGVGVDGTSATSHGVRGNGGSGSGDYGGYFTGYGGVYGYSPNWVGVHGSSDGNYGVYGASTSLNGYGVEGYSPTGVGVYGYSPNGNGVQGLSYTTTQYAGYFYNGGGSGTDRGVGVAGFTGSGGPEDIPSYWKPGGMFAGPNGLIAANSESNGIAIVAVNALSGNAVNATKSSGSGSGDALAVTNYGTGGRAAYIYNSGSSSGDALAVSDNGGGDALYVYNSGGGYAGNFSGNVYVSGNLSAGGTKPFKIDNPVDPANQYLYHYAVESPQVQNMYNGTVVLDAKGEAVVTLPAYFDAVNTGEFQYSLTPIGAPMPNLYVAEEIQGNTFKIAGGVAGKKVSWTVYGQRNDPWLRDNPATDVVSKPDDERGKYLYPQGYGQPETSGLDYARSQAGRSTMSVQTVLLTRTVPLTQTGPVLPTVPVPPVDSVPPVVPGPSTVP